MPDAYADATLPTAQPEAIAEERSQEQATRDTEAPPSDSTTLSSVPPTDSEHKESDSIVVASRKASWTAQSANLERPSADQAAEATPEASYPADAVTSQDPTLSAPTPGEFAIPGPPINGSINDTPRGRGRGRGGRPRGSRASHVVTPHSAPGEAILINPDGTPIYARGRGRGRGGGRPRGSRARGGGRGGKRKRDDDDDDGEASDSSVEITPVATETRSGRSIQKPTSFVPPPPSPTTNKRKRSYNYRNPQAAVCKVCLRGTSPTSNPVVFCDGCNAPYHRWCHKPPIEQAVIDKEDAEWYCQKCAVARVVPVPVAEVASFVSVTGASEDQRRKYFAALSQGLLVTLLVKATTFRPDLPVFDPKFKELVATSQSNGHLEGTAAPTSLSGKESVHENSQAGGAAPTATASAARATAAPESTISTTRPNSIPQSRRPDSTGPAPDDATYTDDIHPENYPRPGQGLMSTLPPETEDLEWLVDDDDKNGVFTHLYHEPRRAPPPVPTASGGDGLV
ncbi:SWM histone demethylase complex subunit phf1 [Cercospora zeina]